MNDMEKNGIKEDWKTKLDAFLFNDADVLQDKGKVMEAERHFDCIDLQMSLEKQS